METDMTATAKFRGHAIFFDEESDCWRYEDDGSAVSEEWKRRGCGHCGLAETPEGHDGCLETLPGPIKNACCGHGLVDEAYVQFDDGEIIRGPDAIQWQISAKCSRPNAPFYDSDGNPIYGLTMRRITQEDVSDDR